MRLKTPKVILLWCQHHGTQMGVGRRSHLWQRSHTSGVSLVEGHNSRVRNWSTRYPFRAKLGRLPHQGCHGACHAQFVRCSIRIYQATSDSASFEILITSVATRASTTATIFQIMSAGAYVAKAQTDQGWSYVKYPEVPRTTVPELPRTFVGLRRADER